MSGFQATLVSDALMHTRTRAKYEFTGRTVPAKLGSLKREKTNKTDTCLRSMRTNEPSKGYKHVPSRFEMHYFIQGKFPKKI